MKKVFFTFVFLTLFADFSAAQEWVQTNGPIGGEIRSIVFNKNKDMFVLPDGLSSLLIRSTDNGVSWKQILVSPFAGITNIAITPNEDIYASTNIGIYKSTDNGDSWVSLSSKTIGGLLISPDGSIYSSGSYQDSTARNNYYLLRSNDDCKTWDSLYIPQISSIHSICVDSNGILLYATFGHIYRSTNRGVSWTKTSNDSMQANYEYLICGRNGNVYVTNQSPFGAALQSSDDGITWNPLPFKRGNFASGRTGRVLYVGAGAELKYSDDNGTTWKDFGSGNQWGIDKSSITFVCADADSGFFIQANGILFHAATSGIHPWSPFTIPLSSILSLVMSANGTLLAATNPHTGYSILSVSNDTGKHWSPLFNPDTGFFAVDWFAIDSNKDIIGGSMDLFRSENNGKDWHRILNPAQRDFLSKVAVQSNGDIFLGTNVDGLYRSTDNGLTWNHVDGLNEKLIFSISVIPSGDLFAGCESANYRSSDNGLTWSSFDISGNSYGKRLHLACNLYGDIFGSDDYVSNLHRSLDNGNTWQTFEDGITDAYSLNGFIETPDGTIFAYTDNGIFKYGVGDCAWTPYSIGLNSMGILSLVSDKSGRLYAGSDGGGVFKSTATFNVIPKLTGRILVEDHDFGTAAVGNTKCEDIIIKNVGLAPFTLTKSFIIIDPVPFSISKQSLDMLPIVIQPKDSVSLSICFHPPQPAVYASEIDWSTDINDTLCTSIKSQSFLHGTTFTKSEVRTSSAEIKFSIHPNPVSGNVLTVSFSESQSQPVALSVFDVLGREVYRNNIMPGLKDFDIPIRDQSEGVYYVRLVSNGVTVTKQFLRVK
jgi:photosystem II stability/assembly factor-like uncharacterized protein